MQSLFDALDDTFYPENPLWKKEIERIRMLDLNGNIQHLQKGVALKMALIHINQDLRYALLKHGVGKDVDWQCVGDQVRQCETENFGKLEQLFNNYIMKLGFDVSAIRDQMREEVKNELQRN